MIIGGTMRLLEEKIRRDGKCIGTEILKVDSFLNHQIDVALIEAIGREFAEKFKGMGINKILTIESSGLPIAYAAALSMGNLPLVFAKKSKPSTMTDAQYAAEVRSFTKNNVYCAVVSKEFLSENDTVLLIDDFLATGQAALGLLDICRQAGAKCVGLGAVIEKEHQGGSEKLRSEGLKVESLAVISSITKDGKIIFKGE